MKDNTINSLNKLIEATISGKVKWNSSGKNAFIWQTSSTQISKLNVVMQLFKVDNDKEDQILFRLWDVEKQMVIMDIRTNETNNDIKTKINELYQAIIGNFGANDILSDILKDI